MDVSILLILLIFVAGGLLGAALGWFAARPAVARLQTQLASEQALRLSQQQAAQEADKRLREAFRALSAEALHANNRAFLDLAETRLREARTEAVSDVEARKKAVEDLLAPLHRTLDQIDREMKDVERRRVESGAALLQRLAALDSAGQGLQTETRRLVDALKRPSVRGRWGELQLRRVVELAGLVDHCDFEEQQTVRDQDRRLRPDLIVRLPGGKHVVVDSKVPLEAYLRAVEATDDAERRQLMADHARQVRAHIGQLSAKGYAAHVRPTPDFVVLFLPGEMFFSAALEEDPTLIEYGIGLDQRVIPASPTTLIALLRAVAYGWQQQAMEENARKISDLGRSLYDAVRVLGGHFEVLGTRLKSSLDAYNSAVGSLEGNVLVKVRRFKELQADASAEEIRTIEPIDRVPRVLQAAELTGGLPFAEIDAIDVSESTESAGRVESAASGAPVAQVGRAAAPRLTTGAHSANDADGANDVDTSRAGVGAAGRR